MKGSTSFLGRPSFTDKLSRNCLISDIDLDHKENFFFFKYRMLV